MLEGIGSVATTVEEGLLWSNLGFAELIVGLIVGLMLLAFALPARTSPDDRRATEAETREGLARERRG